MSQSLFFRVDKQQLVISPLRDPTATINKYSIYIDGKRRDRVTGRYEWTDDIQRAIEVLSAAVADQQIELNREIARLTNIVNEYDTQRDFQVAAARKALQEANDEYFN